LEGKFTFTLRLQYFPLPSHLISSNKNHICNRICHEASEAPPGARPLGAARRSLCRPHTHATGDECKAGEEWCAHRRSGRGEAALTGGEEGGVQVRDMGTHGSPPTPVESEAFVRAFSPDSTLELGLKAFRRRGPKCSL
jgi:hypothetical protein